MTETSDSRQNAAEANQEATPHPGLVEVLSINGGAWVIRQGLRCVCRDFSRSVLLLQEKKHGTVTSGQ